MDPLISTQKTVVPVINYRNIIVSPEITPTEFATNTLQGVVFENERIKELVFKRIAHQYILAQKLNPQKEKKDKFLSQLKKEKKEKKTPKQVKKSKPVSRKVVNKVTKTKKQSQTSDSHTKEKLPRQKKQTIKTEQKITAMVYEIINSSQVDLSSTSSEFVALHEHHFNVFGAYHKMNAKKRLIEVFRSRKRQHLEEFEQKKQELMPLFGVIHYQEGVDEDQFAERYRESLGYLETAIFDGMMSWLKSKYIEAKKEFIHDTSGSSEKILTYQQCYPDIQPSFDSGLRSNSHSNHSVGTDHVTKKKFSPSEKYDLLTAQQKSGGKITSLGATLTINKISFEEASGRLKVQFMCDSGTFTSFQLNSSDLEYVPVHIELDQEHRVVILKGRPIGVIIQSQFSLSFS